MSPIPNTAVCALSRALLCALWLAPALGCYNGEPTARAQPVPGRTIPNAMLTLRRPLLPTPLKAGGSADRLVFIDGKNDIWSVKLRGGPEFVRWVFDTRPLVTRPLPSSSRSLVPVTEVSLFGISRGGRYVFLRADLFLPGQRGINAIHGAVPITDGLIDLAQVQCIPPVCDATQHAGFDSPFSYLTSTDDLSLIATIGNDGVVALWRRNDLEDRYEPIFQAVEPLACDVWLQGDPPKLMIGLTVHGQVYAVDLATGERLWATSIGGPISQWAFDPDNPQLAAYVLGQGIAVYRFGPSGLHPVYRVPETVENVLSVSLSSGQLTVARTTGECQTYEIDQGQLGVWKVPGSFFSITTVAVPEATAVLAIVERQEVAEIYRMPSGELVGRFPLLGWSPRTTYLTFSAGLSALLAGAKRPHAWRLPSGEPAAWNIPRTVPALATFQAERRTRMLFASHLLKGPKVWWYQPRSGRAQPLAGVPTGVNVRVSPSGNRMIVAGENSEKYVVDVRPGASARRVPALDGAMFGEYAWLTDTLVLYWRRGRLGAQFELWDVRELPRKVWAVRAPLHGRTELSTPYVHVVDENRIAFVARDGIGILSIADRKVSWLLRRKTAQRRSWVVATSDRFLVAVERTVIDREKPATKEVIHVWDLNRKRQRLYETSLGVRKAALDELGRFLALACDQGEIHVWKLSDLLPP